MEAPPASDNPRDRMCIVTQYIHDAHSVYCCDYHIVICTKYRNEVINEGLKTYLRSKVHEIVKHYPKLRIKEFNTDKDHVHMFVSIPPSISVGSFVRLYKTNSARNIKQQFTYLRQVYWGTDSLWSEGYFVSTVGVHESLIRKYIKNQGASDAGQTASLFE